MTPHRAFTVDEPSRVGEARRAVMALADSLGFDETAAGRAALVVTELGTNLVKHAPGGRLLLGLLDPDTPHAAIEVLSLDRGPGMADFGACLVDGFSTAGTPGTGLGAAKRMADSFDAYSLPGAGTTIVARVAGNRQARPPASRFHIGAVATAAPGESVCGDTWFFGDDGGSADLMMADGLGHGPMAAEASEMAASLFATGRPGDLGAWIVSAHAPMRSTRGAAVAAARLDADAATVTLCGAGNIATRIVSGVADRTLLSQHGTLGVQIGRPQPAVYPWPDHALVVMHSDGIATRWDLKALPGLMQCSAIVIAGWLLQEHLRGKDDATVVVVRRD